MEIYILNDRFETIEILDTFQSVIWVDRYNSFGDFEINTYATKNIIETVRKGAYLWYSGSEHLMIPDESIIDSERYDGSIFSLRGRSLEWLLNRAIIWNQTNLSGNFQNGIQRLLNENIINPSISGRRRPNFIFQPSTNPEITSLTINNQFTGQNLFTVISDLCKERNIGFRVTLNNNNQFVFSMYMGVDRSYAQEINPYVIFSPEFDNLKDSNFLESSRILKNVALVAGEGEGAARRTVPVGSVTGWERRELFVDARDISSNTQEGQLSPTQYNALLTERGRQRLSEHKLITEFEGNAETTQIYVYGRDFFLGDIVHSVNEFDIGANVRVSEIIFGYNNDNGMMIVPTFSIIQ